MYGDGEPPPLAIRARVGAILDALCEGSGVTEDEGEEFEVRLADWPMRVRAYESPPVVSIYAELAGGLPCSAALLDRLHDHNRHYLVFRVFWEDGSVLLRADVPAEPLSAGLLQSVLESFVPEAESLADEFQGTSE